MNILILGSHGTGKSTLAIDIQEALSLLYDCEVHILDGVSRFVKHQGFSINEEGDQATQEVIFNKVLEKTKKHEELLQKSAGLDGSEPVFINVSSIPRVWAYTIFYMKEGKRFNHRFVDCVFNVAKCHVAHMADIVMWLPIEFGIEDDGVRSTDKVFQQTINDYLFDFMCAHAQKGKIMELNGSREERLERALIGSSRIWKNAFSSVVKARL